VRAGTVGPAGEERRRREASHEIVAATARVGPGPEGSQWAVSARDDLAVHFSFRRLSAVLVAVALLVLVGCDLWIGSVRTWWDHHSLTGSVVSNLLVLAVTGLIVDEVVARRQRRERGVSVAVQALIVYGQTRRAYEAITADAGDDPSSDRGPDELRTLAGMLLTAAPNLFDDPPARRFLEQVERFSVSMIRAVSPSSAPGPGADGRTKLTAELSEVKTAMEPLLARIPIKDRALLEDSG
jgi:hypothetical protein